MVNRKIFKMTIFLIMSVCDKKRLCPTPIYENEIKLPWLQFRVYTGESHVHACGQHRVIKNMHCNSMKQLQL